MYSGFLIQEIFDKVKNYMGQLTEERGRNFLESSGVKRKVEESSKAQGRDEKVRNLESLFCTNELAVSSDSEVSVDQEQKRQQGTKESIPFQVSEKKIHSDEEKMENNGTEKIFLVFGGCDVF